MKKYLTYLILILVILIPFYFLFRNKEAQLATENNNSSSTKTNKTNKEQEIKKKILIRLDAEENINPSEKEKIKELKEKIWDDNLVEEEVIKALKEWLLQERNEEFSNETPENKLKIGELVQEWSYYLDEYWNNIHPDFYNTSLREKWSEQKLKKEIVKDWISIGLGTHEYELVGWLVG